MNKRENLLKIAELLEVKQYLNETKSTNEEIIEIIANRCLLSNGKIHKSILIDGEIDLSKSERWEIIDSVIALRKNIKSSIESSTDPSDDYSTLMMVGNLNSVLGWIMVVSCAVAVVIGIIGEGFIAFIGIVCIPISLLVVASGQMISCFVSTERNSKNTSVLLQKILDKMEKTE